MGTAAIIAIIQTIITELPGAITTAEQVYDLAKKLFTTVNGRAPTDAEVEDLETQIDADVADALQPLPPAQPGDPDYQA
jgi:hypothetical protein